MCFIKKWICKIFKYEDLKHDYEFAKAVIESYKREIAENNKAIAELKEICADPISYVENALKESAEAYEKCVADMEELLAKQDRLEHKAYARGRSDAYAEMGIKALDARMNGETIYCDWDGNVIDEMNVKDFRNFCEENEIEIDDLVTGDE